MQDVVRGDAEALATFFTCTKRLCTSLAAQCALLHTDRAYEIDDLVAMTLTHLALGTRPSGRYVSPAQTWLANREQAIPLETHFANYAHWFLQSLARKRRIETALKRAENEEIDDDAPYYYDNLPDDACAVAEEVIVHNAFQVWWQQCTAADQTLMRKIAPEGEALTLEEAAQQLGTSVSTVHRRKERLRNDLVAFLRAD
jgi:hypothetical protein